MINQFLQYLQYEKNYSAHTVLSYMHDLEQFLEFISIEQVEFKPEEVESETIRMWVVSLLQGGMSARSIARKVSTLKSFWRFMLVRGYAINNPTLKIVLPKTKKPLPVFFKEKEIQEVLEDPFRTEGFEDVRNLLMIEMFYQTGIRLSELISIQDTDVDVYRSEIRVIGKRNKERIIPIPVHLSERIAEYQSVRNEKCTVNCPNLFVRPSGDKLYPKLVYNVVHRVMSKVSSLQKVSPHVLRHSFATGLLNGGADIYAVKELLGHSSLAATQVYTHTGFGELYTIYQQAHPRAKTKGGNYET